MSEITNSLFMKANKKDYLKVSLLFFGAALLVLIMLVVSPKVSVRPEFFVLLVLLLLSLLLMQILMVRYLRNREHQEYPWLHLPSLIVVWTLLSFGIPALAGFFLPERVTVVQRLIGFDYRFFILGWVLIVAGCFAIWVGYILGFRVIKPFGFMISIAEATPSLAATVGVYLFVVATRLFRVSNIGIGFGADRYGLGFLEPFTQVLTYFEEVSLLILALVAYQVFRGQWPRIVFIAVLASELLASFSSGFSKPVLSIIVIVLVVAVLAGVEKKRIAMYSSVFVVLGLLVIPISQQLRYSFGTYDNRSPLSVLQATRSAYNSTWGQGVDTGLAIANDKLLDRQLGLPFHPGIIIKKTPQEVPYQGLEELVVMPAYVLPRFIWQNKPVLSRGVWFSIAYLNRPLDTQSSGGFTLFGESYIYLGWTSSALLLFLFGVLLAILTRNTLSVGLVAFYAAFIPVIVDIDVGITAKLIGIIQAFAVYLFFQILIVSFPGSRLFSRNAADDASNSKSESPSTAF